MPWSKHFDSCSYVLSTIGLCHYAYTSTVVIPPHVRSQWRRVGVPYWIDGDTGKVTLCLGRYQRNFGGQPVSVQWLDGSMSAVLPVDYASRQLVLIPPTKGDRQCAESGLYADTLLCLRLFTRANALARWECIKVRDDSSICKESWDPVEGAICMEIDF